MKKFQQLSQDIQESQDQKRIFGDLLCNLQDSSLYFTDKTATFSLPKLKIDEIINSHKNSASRISKKSFKVLENGKKISKTFSKEIQKFIQKPKVKPTNSAPVLDFGVWDDTLPVQHSKKLIASTFTSTEYMEPIVPVRKPKLPLTCKMEIEISHPGASYNPTKGDHDDLIQEAYKEELDKISRKEKIQEKLEYSKELDAMDDDMTREIIESESERELELEPLKKSSDKKKTRIERNKIRKQEEKKRIFEKETQIKKLYKDINKIKEIQKELQIQKIKVKKEKDISKVTLGPFKFKKDGLEVQLSDEISENLRKFKPEGNLFKDRFKAFQKNQMIETRLPQSAKAAKRRYRLKETESHDYKRFK